MQGIHTILILWKKFTRSTASDFFDKILTQEDSLVAWSIKWSRNFESYNFKSEATCLLQPVCKWESNKSVKNARYDYYRKVKGPTHWNVHNFWTEQNCLGTTMMKSFKLDEHVFLTMDPSRLNEGQTDSPTNGQTGNYRQRCLLSTQSGEPRD